MIRMKATGGQVAFAYGTPSRQFNVDAHGVAEIDDAAAPHAVSHGFRPLTAAEEAEIEKAAAPPAPTRVPTAAHAKRD